MAIIDFNSSIWSKPWFRRLSPTAKVLFVYLWTNNHKNLTGMYELDFETMQFETGLNKKQITDTLSILYPKIKYDIKKEIVWVVNHVQHQFMRTPKISPKIITGIEKCLISLDNHPFVEEFLNKYDTLSIQYTYCSGGGEGVECIGEGKGKGKGDGGSKGDGEITECWILPDGIKSEIWQEYEDHRKTTKTKLTDAARTKNANVLLENLSDQQEIVDNTIRNGWTGLFPLTKKGGQIDSRYETHKTKGNMALLQKTIEEFGG